MVEESTFITKKARLPKSQKPRHCRFFYMLVKGIEPPAYALRVRCSTPELHQLIEYKKKRFNRLFGVTRNIL